MNPSDNLRLANYLRHRLQAIHRIQGYTRDIDEIALVIAHGYFKVDIPIVWRTIELDLPQLEKQVSRLQTSLT